ncbi:MAG: hypothetical protein QF681_04380 [Vicinamibacterales bacterium]|nr:hypothetical protein [Vicinamibacterales bacterium]
MPRSLLVLGSTVLLTALLVVAYLLGRDAGRTEQAATGPPAAVAPEPVEPTVPPRATTRQSPRPQRPSAPAPLPPLTQPSPASPPSPAPVSEPAAPDDPVVDARERAEVARYFEQVDEVAGSSGGAGDPETLAMALLSQATGGDWSQFDELGDTQRSMLRRLRRLQVPSPCRNYHEKMVSLLEAGASLLDEVKQGVQSGDLGALSTLATTAQRLQAEAEEARRLAAGIEQHYDL